MIFGRKKPSENQIEDVVLRVALVADSKESVFSLPCSPEEIASFIEDVFRDLKLKPDQHERNITKLSVQALLAERRFLDAILDRLHANPPLPLPGDWRRQMRIAIEHIVEGFMKTLK